ncbi:MAG: RNA repair domain-containing protein [Syntrophobacteraceae bacterium]
MGHFEAGDRFSFRYEDESGDRPAIPFHRIRQVFRDGILIWNRAG